MKSTKTRVTPVEPMEGRGEAKGKLAPRNVLRTQGRDGTPTDLARVGRKATKDKETRFSNLMCHLKLPLLEQAYRRLKKAAAAGVDGVTWSEYGQDLEARLTDLQGRVHRGSYHPSPVRARERRSGHQFTWRCLLYNPASEIELPRLGRRLPRHVLTAAEVESVLAVPDVSDPLGLRDRAVLETLYSTGIRRSELVKLHVFDVDVERGTILVREGKRSNDRVVPIGERALAWVEKYQREVRQQLRTDANNTVLFVSKLGDGLTPGHLTEIVRRHVKVAGIGKTGSCHLFRHAMATLMLERGAVVRMVQAMLGHASLNTTALYTHVAIRALKEVHERTHPGARLGKPEAKKTTPTPEAEALLATLAAEADGDHE